MVFRFRSHQSRTAHRPLRMAVSSNSGSKMLRLPFRRGSRWRYLRYAGLLGLILLFADTQSLWKVGRPRVSSAPAHKTNLDKIFIASTHWNNEGILRSHWNKGIVQLAEVLGAENIYVSVYESGSWDNSKSALRELEKELEALGVNNTIILDDTTHEDELLKTPGPTGWIETPRGEKELRRIPYLSRLRNLSLQPLEDLESQGLVFDKILFLNDVVFTTDDVLTLLDTRSGSYAAACSLDFQRPPKYYDTFALRDSDGHKAVTQNFPYFGSSASRSALVASAPVPVQSCWNGMAVFDAAPFYRPKSPLRFRGIPDSLALHHLEGSECCLIHFDNPLTKTKGVWINPAVRVGYNPQAYEIINSLEPWPTGYERVKGMWTNRFVRWFRFTRATIENWTVQRRMAQWKKENVKNTEPGVACLINEMQVLVGNGWAHV